MHSSKAKRFYFLDHARGFVIALVVLQHAVQAYCEIWGGRLWFVHDLDRSRLYDALFMFTDGFIMQALFFIAGLFVLPSFGRRKWWQFIFEKILRLGVPFGIGIFTIVPLLVYVKYLQEGGEAGYFGFLTKIFIFDRLQAGGFWFLALLFGFTLAAIILYVFLPWSIRFLGYCAQKIMDNPIVGFFIMGLLGALFIGVSDLTWGAPWWIGFKKVFYVRANMFFTYILYFLLGLGFSYCEAFSKEKLLKQLHETCWVWGIVTLGLTLLYLGYTLSYADEGAFSNEIRHYFQKGGQWSTSWPLILEEAPKVLIRTTLHGFLCASQVITVIALMYRIAPQAHSLWTPLAVCSYGIYFLHEPFVAWTQYGLIDSGLPALFKIIISFVMGLSMAWLITERCLRRWPLTKKIF